MFMIANNTLTLNECVGQFSALRFVRNNFARYPEYFDEESVMVQASMGEFRGPGKIVEYGTWMMWGGAVLLHETNKETVHC